MLPAAFAAATIGAIANTTKALLALDAAAIKSGASIETVSKLTRDFQGYWCLGFRGKQGRCCFLCSIEKAKMDEITQASRGYRKGTGDGWFGWEGFKTPGKIGARHRQGGRICAGEIARTWQGSAGYDPLLKSIRDIQTSTADAEVKFNQLMAIFFKMGNTARRNAAILYYLWRCDGDDNNSGDECWP